jgi:hypothetical protein
MQSRRATQSKLPLRSSTEHRLVQNIDGLRQCGLEVLLTFSNREPKLASEDLYFRHNLAHPRLFAGIEVALHVASVTASTRPARSAPRASASVEKATRLWGSKPFSASFCSISSNPSVAYPVTQPTRLPESYLRLGCLEGYHPRR